MFWGILNPHFTAGYKAQIPTTILGIPGTLGEFSPPDRPEQQKKLLCLYHEPIVEASDSSRFVERRERFGALANYFLLVGLAVWDW